MKPRHATGQTVAERAATDRARCFEPVLIPPLVRHLRLGLRVSGNTLSHVARGLLEHTLAGGIPAAVVALQGVRVEVTSCALCASSSAISAKLGSCLSFDSPCAISPGVGARTTPLTTTTTTTTTRLPSGWAEMLGDDAAVPW